MEINFDELKQDTLLERAILRMDGTLLVNRGTKLTESMIERLRKLEGSIKFEGDIPEEALPGIDSVKETISEKLRADTEESLSEFLIHPTDIQVQKIKENINEIVEKSIKTEEPQYDLDMYLEQQDENIAHAIRVASFSILLARIYNKTLKTLDSSQQIDLRDIAVAAALQDVGIIYKDDEKLRKLTEIPEIDRIETFFPGIRNTPLDYYDERYAAAYSYCAVADMENVNKTSKLMILLSKEPDILQGPLMTPLFVKERRNNIVYGAKIINVCNVYDNAMKRAIDSGSSLEEVVAELGHYARNGIISEEMKELLINRVKLYPYKTRVLLSNGRVATVENSRVGQYDSYKPVVRISPYGKIIDLKESTKITIKSVVKKEKFHELMQQQIEEMKNPSVPDDSAR